MVRIRKLEIRRFRCIRDLVWHPSDGINCLVGPGDTGKSTVLDAIDLCLGARRTPQVGDDDFFRLDTSDPVEISVTLGALDEELKRLDTYGPYLRGFDPESKEITDEPGNGLETVLTLKLTIGDELEPRWHLVSERAPNEPRGLSWADRRRVAPLRLGEAGIQHLAWRKGSILHHLADESADVGSALAQAGRDIRVAFGAKANEGVPNTLKAVAETAKSLGIICGSEVSALLDAQSVSFSGGTVSLHGADGVPLRCLGLGSTRLLIAGLQRRARDGTKIVLVDEVEHGLEPHRIIRLLHTLGSKEDTAPLQVFMTSHSPVAIRELSTKQIGILRCVNGRHSILPAAACGDVQGAIRREPEALLARAVLVCEGPTEIGFIRGLDQERSIAAGRSLMAMGVALVDGGGTNTLKRALAFQALGYKTAILRDTDRPADEEERAAFLGAGGSVFEWEGDRAIETELFASLPDDAVEAMIEAAIAEKGEDLIDDHIRSASKGSKCLNDLRTMSLISGYSPDERTLLSLAATSKKGAWFKNISAMEDVARIIVAPALDQAEPSLRGLVERTFAWSDGA